MIKRIAYFAFCSLLGHVGAAQLPDGSLAPNITGVDLQGNSYDVHALLGEGKAVVIDISATWCLPCYTVHSTHFFDLVQQTYGPQGTDELVVLLLEADGNTDLADLQGTGDYTVGDWTYCTAVPILDDMNTVYGDYQCSYWGSYFVINPADTTTKFFDAFSYDELLPHLMVTGIIDVPTFDASVGFVCDEGPEYICSSANSFTPTLALHNLGSSPLTSVSFDLYVDGVFHSTQEWTGNIPSFRSEELALQPIALAGNAEVTVVIDQPGDGNTTNNAVQLTVELSSASTDGEITVVIDTDNLGAETYWQVVDDGGAIVASGGNPWVGTTNIGIGLGADFPETPPGTYASDQSYTETVQLEPGVCYEFVITDYFGGGINSELGGYTVTDELGNILFAGAEFDDMVVHPFRSTVATSVEDTQEAMDIRIHADPVQDQLVLWTDITQADIRILDLQGRQVHQEAWAQRPIGISHLSAGAYLVHLSTGSRTWTARVVKE